MEREGKGGNGKGGNRNRTELHMVLKGRIKNQRLPFPPSKRRHSFGARQDRTSMLSCTFRSSLLPAYFQTGRGALPTGHCWEQRKTTVHWKNHLAQEKLAFPTSEVCASTATRIPAGHHQMGWNNFSIDNVRSGSLPLPMETQAPCQNGTTRMGFYASPPLRH